MTKIVALATNLKSVSKAIRMEIRLTAPSGPIEKLGSAALKRIVTVVGVARLGRGIALVVTPFFFWEFVAMLVPATPLSWWAAIVGYIYVAAGILSIVIYSLELIRRGPKKTRHDLQSIASEYKDTLEPSVEAELRSRCLNYLITSTAERLKVFLIGFRVFLERRTPGRKVLSWLLLEIFEWVGVILTSLLALSFVHSIQMPDLSWIQLPYVSQWSLQGILKYFGDLRISGLILVPLLGHSVWTYGRRAPRGVLVFDVPRMAISILHLFLFGGLAVSSKLSMRGTWSFWIEPYQVEPRITPELVIQSMKLAGAGHPSAVFFAEKDISAYLSSSPGREDFGLVVGQILSAWTQLEPFVVLGFADKRCLLELRGSTVKDTRTLSGWSASDHVKNVFTSIVKKFEERQIALFVESYIRPSMHLRELDELVRRATGGSSQEETPKGDHDGKVGSR